MLTELLKDMFATINQFVKEFRVHFAPVFGLLFAFLGVITAISSIIKPDIFTNEQKAETLEMRIGELTRSLGISAKLVSEIEQEIEKRRTLVGKLQEDAEQAKKLSALNAEQVAAVAQALRGELHKEDRTSFWIGVATNLFFAILGASFGELFRWLRTRRRQQLVEERAQQGARDC